MKNWPRLSETLPHAQHPKMCGNCGVGDETKLVHVWIEHDENDRPEMKFVTLCDPCADKIIEPHPRLYSPVGQNVPMPGIMDICLSCTRRVGMACTSPLAKFNGGPGMNVNASKPITAFVDGTRNGRRVGWRMRIFSTPPNACTGRTLL